MWHYFIFHSQPLSFILKKWMIAQLMMKINVFLNFVNTLFIKSLFIHVFIHLKFLNIFCIEDPNTIPNNFLIFTLYSNN